MPYGFVSDNPWGQPEEARLGMTEEMNLPASTWQTDNVLKWSAFERMCRGAKADKLSEQVEKYLMLAESAISCSKLAAYPYPDSCSG